MTHEIKQRTRGEAAGPEDSESLPDATTIPTHETAKKRRRTPAKELENR